mgnify:CR=1 FL=1
MFERIKQVILSANEVGIPIPLLRDNNTGKGSYTLTMFWISFNLAILLLAGKVTKVIGDVDYSNVLWLLGITGGLYLGRKTQQSSSGGISIDSQESKGPDNAR